MAKKRSRKLLRNLLIIAGLVIVGLIGLRALGFGKKEDAFEVSMAEAKKVEIVEKVTASGKVQPETEVKISPDVSGEVIDVLIEEGDSVSQGTLLFRIRPDNIQAAVESSGATVNARRANLSQAQADLSQTKAQLVQAEADFKRNQDLFEQKVISEADFQTSQANYQVAIEQVRSAEQNVEASRFNMANSQATLKQNLDNLSRTEIYAPVSGIVSKLSVEKGETVVGTGQMAGTEMLILADLNNMEVQVDVNENDIIRVKRGQSSDIDVDSYSSSGRIFKGIVTEIANTATETTTADAVTEFLVKVRILNESYKDLANQNTKPFRPGMTASVDIITQKKAGILSVPIAAVTTREAKKGEAGGKDKGKADIKKTSNDSGSSSKDDLDEIVFVYDKDSGTIKAQKVKTGISDFENIEILEGLEEGQTVITGPFLIVSKQLKDGDKVKKMEKKSFGRGGRK